MRKTKSVILEAVHETAKGLALSFFVGDYGKRFNID